MSRPIEKCVAYYRDEKGDLQEIEIPIAGGIDLGELVNRATNGEVNQGSHVISKNGKPAENSAPVQPGDRVTASPRKTGGG